MILNSEHEIQPWWNRPVVGKITLSQRLIGFINRQLVPEVSLILHKTELEKLTKIAPTLQMLDNPEFNQEFLGYISIKSQIENNEGEYEGLETFIKILRFGIEKNKYFCTIQRIELDYQGKTQRELYDFVFEQLNNNLDRVIFKRTVIDKVENLISIVKNEPIKIVLENYIHCLKAIASEQIGLDLWLLCKKYNLNNYQLFQIIYDILKQLKKENLTNLKPLVLAVKVNFEELENLGKLIGIPNTMNQEIIFAKILRYIALSYQYEKLNYRFYQLVENLVKWQGHYQILVRVREEYPSYKYKLPEEFMRIIPGENIYQKYQSYLSFNEIKIKDEFLE